MSGTAELHWISEGNRLLVTNGLEPVFLAPGSRQAVDQNLYRQHPLVCHIAVERLGFDRQLYIQARVTLVHPLTASDIAHSVP